jgi:hypothetical protein
LDPLTITIDPEELMGLRALVEIARAGSGLGGGSDAGAELDADVADTARALVHDGLIAKLDGLGLSWAPTPDAVAARAAKAAQVHVSSSNTLRALALNARVKRYGVSILLVVLFVVLLGGYAGGWNWTGFAANNQLWDWLHLLLLPVVLGTVPIWLLHAERMSRARRLIFGMFVVAFAGFTVAGYLIPLNWTGFRGNTLWDWFLLLVLPLTLVMTRAWAKSSRSLRMQHKAIIVLLAVGWVVTLFGGYALAWNWTGYQGNTLWDWLQLLLLPLVFPTILLPAALKWVSGNAAELAHEEPSAGPRNTRHEKADWVRRVPAKAK